MTDTLALEARPMTHPVKMVYRNWRGEISKRTITPKRVWFGPTDWHPEAQWILTAFDHDKQADRDFALADFCASEDAATLRRERDEARAERDRIVEDRARFPDRPDDIGRMIEAHIGNLKAGKEAADGHAIKAMNDLQRIAALLAEAGKVLEQLLAAYSFYFPVGNPWGDKARALATKIAEQANER